MKRFIEFKHIGPKALVRRLIDELCDRLEEKLRHFDADAVSLHVVFEENGSQKLYRAAVSCHVPQYMAAAHEEDRNPGAALRGAFEEVEHQLDKHRPLRGRKILQKKRAAQRRQPAPAREMAAEEENV